MGLTGQGTLVRLLSSPPRRYGTIRPEVRLLGQTAETGGRGGVTGFRGLGEREILSAQTRLLLTAAAAASCCQEHALCSTLQPCPSGNWKPWPYLPQQRIRGMSRRCPLTPAGAQGRGGSSP